MYPLHPRDHSFLLEERTRRHLQNQRRLRLAHARRQALLDEERLARAWAELTSALEAMKHSQEELAWAGTKLDT